MWSKYKEMDLMANKHPTQDTTKWNLGDTGGLGKWVTFCFKDDSLCLWLSEVFHSENCQMI